MRNYFPLSVVYLLPGGGGEGGRPSLSSQYLHSHGRSHTMIYFLLLIMSSVSSSTSPTSTSSLYLSLSPWIKYWSYGLWVGEGETRRVNTDTFTPIMVRLGEEDSLGIVMDRIRVFPVSDYPRTVCLRLELCSCELEEGQHQHTWQEVHDKVHDVQEELSGVRASQDTGREMDSLNPNLMSVVIRVLVTIILVLTTVIIFIL